MFNGKTLILVHPGSACGSADFNIGRDLADECRLDLIRCLNLRTDNILILDNSFGDELLETPYKALNDAINTAIGRSQSLGKTAIRREAEDPDQVKVVEELFQSDSIDRKISIVITGAWYHPQDDGGCVNSVYDKLMALGYKNIDVDNSAFNIDAAVNESEDTTDHILDHPSM